MPECSRNVDTDAGEFLPAGQYEEHDNKRTEPPVRRDVQDEGVPEQLECGPAGIPDKLLPIDVQTSPPCSVSKTVGGASDME